MKTQASTTLTREQLGIVHRVSWWIAGVCLIACVALPAAARVRHNDAWARAQFSKADRTREALNGRPAGERTRHEYQRAIDAYRRVYFGSPSSSKADPSVVATAELMVEMGRRFDDNKILRGAVDEYRFLRKEYPGSKYRFEALFTIGEIYKDDLKDPDEARKTFEDFLHRYPRNRLADDARAAVKEIDNAAVEAQRSPHQGQKKKEKAREREVASGRASKTEGGGPSKSLEDGPGEPSKGTAPEKETASNVAGANGAGANGSGANGASSRDSSDAGSGNDATTDTAGAQTNSDSAAEGAHRGELPRVTGVRHWSTPNYTRVAIDIERDVKFDSQRISNPDRIFFDLKDTKLASTLVGKSFDVDDGFLKKIRVAEFRPGRTRVVLEVDDLSSYDAFLLPNPYRLIIDIHGKQSRASVLAKERVGSAQSSAENSTESDEASASAPARDADEEHSDLTAERAGKKKSEKEHAIVAKVKPQREDDSDNAQAKADAASDGDGAKTESGNAAVENSSAKGSKVVKTTTAVKGSNRTIPKTIVDADDDDSPSASRAHATKHGQSLPGNSRGVVAKNEAPASDPPEDDNDSAVSEAKNLAPDVENGSHGGAKTNSTRAQNKSITASHRKKSRSRGDADDLAQLEMREAQPMAAGDRSLTRALGLKIGKIVIDAGHGGHDTGTIGPNGLLEKDLVLDVARRLGRLLEARLGAEVVYTRRDDTFVPLETRTAIANREQADLFISIHANSSHDPDARGVETYYLNFTSSPEALEVAARENAVSEKSVHELQDLVKKIALKEKIDESREFASDVQDSLYGGLALHNAGIKNRGVKKAPFIVLIGANMPSILAEISFVSNPTDERKLEGSEQRQRIAESLYRGVAKYAGGLSGVKVASKIEKPSGQ
ncbi:MAG: N-acetylmuramoyl-L-alanine amidase [Terriglobales bacterium]